MNVHVKIAIMYANVRAISAILRVYDVPTFIWTAHLTTMMRYVLTMAKGMCLRCGDGEGEQPLASEFVLPLRLPRAYLEWKREARRRTATKKMTQTRKYQTWMGYVCVRCFRIAWSALAAVIEAAIESTKRGTVRAVA
jgi:hypothetical protein